VHSSTSDSKGLRASTAITLLLGALAAYFCLLEVAMRLIVPRFSAEQQREQQDNRAALAMQSTTSAGSPTVLILGNSLLLHGVVRSQLRESLAPRYAVELFPIENTTFLDWYFGLRRLFTQGSRPGVVILCMNVRELISNSTDGEGFAHNMMLMRDLPRVKKLAGLDMMVISDYFFANVSSWIGGRVYFRNAVLEELFPHASKLVAHFAQVAPPQMTATSAVISSALRHLREIEALCKSRGAGFIMLIPPTLVSHDPAPIIAADAAKEGIPVLIPYRPGEMPSAAFSDGFHLNPSGAALFTDRLDRALPAQLSASHF
jgi:hypothetical protein